MKSFIKVVVALVLVMSLFSPTAFAKSDQAKESLVALGDSIPFGYNLGKTNQNPAKTAYPFVIGDSADLRVRNLGVPGWQTSQLLDALQTDQKYRQAVKHSDYIVLTIGNNDLLAILRDAQIESGGDPALFQQLLQSKLSNSNIFVNIGAIIQEIRSLTDAQIVMYNVYNPFQLNDPLHFVAASILPQINFNFSAIAGVYPGIVVADAFSAFGNNQAQYVIVNDIHPTIDGQIVLAQLGLTALGLQ